MKTNLQKRILACITALFVIICCTPVLAASAEETEGTILWLSHLTSGVQYESTVNYLSAICEELGYKFTVVYGDGSNDAAGNLQAVKNGMTKDVKGMVVTQDGGLATIMEEFPDLYVAGYNTNMDSVFAGGENASCLEMDHFLGTIADGFIDGADSAKLYFDICLEKGYKKIAVVNFPGFAYPNLEKATNVFLSLVEEYNASAAEEDKLTIVGDVKTLMFAPLDDSWFLDGDNANADVIVGFCAGTLFIYPPMITAIANGAAQPNMKLITSGYESEEAIAGSIGDGEDKVISCVVVSPSEDPAYPLVLLDNAISGNQYDDFEVKRIDSYECIIDTDEEAANVASKSLLGTGNPEYAQISIDFIVDTLCRKNNPDATFAMLIDTFQSDALLNTETLSE